MTADNLPTADDVEVSPVEAIMRTEIATAPLALDASNPVHFDMMTRLQQLEEALLARDPMMKVHLAAAHKLWTTNEELVHLLSHEQIGKIVSAQMAHTNTTLISEITAKTAKSGARAAKISINDL